VVVDRGPATVVSAGRVPSVVGAGRTVTTADRRVVEVVVVVVDTLASVDGTARGSVVVIGRTVVTVARAVVTVTRGVVLVVVDVVVRTVRAATLVEVDVVVLLEVVVVVGNVVVVVVVEVVVVVVVEVVVVVDVVGAAAAGAGGVTPVVAASGVDAAPLPTELIARNRTS
jgi:hypothetical protein